MEIPAPIWMGQIRHFMRGAKSGQPIAHQYAVRVQRKQNLFLRHPLQIDKAGARNAAQTVGQPLGLARRAGQAEPLGFRQRKDRSIAPCPITVEIRFQNAHREVSLCIRHRVTDLRPKLLDGL